MSCLGFFLLPHFQFLQMKMLNEFDSGRIWNRRSFFTFSNGIVSRTFHSHSNLSEWKSDLEIFQKIKIDQYLLKIYQQPSFSLSSNRKWFRCEDNKFFIASFKDRLEIKHQCGVFGKNIIAFGRKFYNFMVRGRRGSGLILFMTGNFLWFWWQLRENVKFSFSNGFLLANTPCWLKCKIHWGISFESLLNEGW